MVAPKILGKSKLNKLATILLATFVFVIIFPILLILYVPVHLYRKVIAKLCQLYRPDLIRILEPHSASYAATKVETNVVLYLKLKGEPDEERLNDWKWGFFNKVILARHKDSGELLYPEFQQYIIKWCGFPFWKVDEQFSIYNHISNRNYNRESDLNAIETELLRTNCAKLQSPWELVICQNPSNSSGELTIFFKFHHSLADGSSIFNALMNWTDTPAITSDAESIPGKAAPILPLIGKIRQYANFAFFPLRASYDLAKTLVEQHLAGKLWDDFKSENKSDLRIYHKSRSLDTKNLKKISTEFKISFTAVLAATIANGLIKFLNKSGRNIPEFIACPMPMKIPAKTGSATTGLQNSFTIGSLNLPLSMDNKEEQLKLCDSFLQETKTSTYGKVVFLMLQFVGKLPLCFLRKQPKMMDPIFFSNFAGPKDKLSLDGFDILDISFSANFSKCYPMVITLLSYNGRIRFVLNVDNNLFDSEEILSELMSFIEEEFEAANNNNIDNVTVVE